MLMKFAEGGHVEGSKNLPPITDSGCTYYIPLDFARRWKESLEKINERVDSPEEDGVE